MQIKANKAQLIKSATRRLTTRQKSHKIKQIQSIFYGNNRSNAKTTKMEWKDRPRAQVTELERDLNFTLELNIWVLNKNI